MKSIDVKFLSSSTDEFAIGRSARNFTGKGYAYLVSDAQAQEIIDKKIEFAVVAVPTAGGALKVVKIVGVPADNPGKAERPIISLVDFAAYEQFLINAEKIKRVRIAIDQRAKEIAEEARLAALASGDDQIAKLLEELKSLQA